MKKSHSYYHIFLDVDTERTGRPCLIIAKLNYCSTLLLRLVHTNQIYLTFSIDDRNNARSEKERRVLQFISSVAGQLLEGKSRAPVALRTWACDQNPGSPSHHPGDSFESSTFVFLPAATYLDPPQYKHDELNHTFLYSPSVFLMHLCRLVKNVASPT